MDKYISKDDIVVDATAGNGFDTVYLAKLVGERGKVYSFDIQTQAIKNTKKKVKENGYQDRVRVFAVGHENIGKYVSSSIKGMIFNLGYLPGADKDVVTRKDTTLKAVESGLELLEVGGIIVLVIYTGHPGGMEELNALKDFALTLDNKQYNVLSYDFINQDSSPQILSIIRRQ
ncbi:MAG: class I SAM-dependent methyltransferase [Bacillota bacterium]